MSGPTGTRSSERSTHDSPSRLSVLTQLATNLTTADLQGLIQVLWQELGRRAKLDQRSTGDSGDFEPYYYRKPRY